MNALKSLSVKGVFTREELQGLEVGELAQLEGYTPGVTQITSKRLIKIIGNRAPNLADVALIAEVRQAKKQGTLLSCGQYEELTWAKGGQVTYTQDTVTLEMTGRTQVVRNSPIPTSVQCEREGFDMMRVQICALFAISKGVVIRVIPDAEWSARFGYDGSHMVTSGIAIFEKVLLEVFEDHPTYKVLVESQRTLSGRDYFQFVAEALRLTSDANYWSLHDVYVVNLTRSVTISTDVPPKIHRVMARNKDGLSANIVDPKAYALKNDPTTKSFHEAMGRNPFVLKGPLPVSHKFFSKDKPSLEIAIKAVTTGNALRGGHSHGVGLMIAGEGFSGMQSERVRRLSLFAAAAIPLLQQGKKIDIRVEAQDIPPLALTFKVHAKNADVKYVVSSIHISSLGVYDCDAILTPRVDSIYLFWDDEVAPSVSAKKDASTVWNEHGAKKFERYIKTPVFIAFCTILSPLYFDSARVYYHSLPVEFRGICTTVPNFTLFGMEDSKLKEVKPVAVVDFPSFLSLVVDANIKCNTFFMAPRTFYSPLANILTSPKGHLKLEIGAGGEWTWAKVAKTETFSPVIINGVQGEDLSVAAQDQYAKIPVGETLLGPVQTGPNAPFPSSSTTTSSNTSTTTIKEDQGEEIVS